MNRGAIDAVDMVSTMQKDIEESKTEQFFGGDSLTVNEFRADLAGEVATTRYKLTLTPLDTKLGVLPSSLEFIWDNPAQTGQAVTNYICWQIFRDDGIFEWRIEGSRVADFDTSMVFQWIGKGEVNLEVVNGQ